MKARHLIIIGFVVLLAAAIGCSSEAEKAKERAAIARAIAYDEQVSSTTERERETNLGFWGRLGWPKPEVETEAYKTYVSRLRYVPLDGCPSDFADAYREHIKAWEKGDTFDIKATWDRVTATARKYGVDE